MIDYKNCVKGGNQMFKLTLKLKSMIIYSNKGLLLKIILTVTISSIIIINIVSKQKIW